MKIELNLYPGGKKKALTMSYDDGTIHDRKLVEIFNRYGIKGTFHLNSGFLDDGRLMKSELAQLFAGHEISVHTVTHPHIDSISVEELVREITEDRKCLEEQGGYPVRGMSYPFGTYDSEVIKALPFLGIEYARTALSTRNFYLPEDFLEWHPTCHHYDDLLQRLEEFLQYDRWPSMPLFYVWGHSYEFHECNDWEYIEDFCQRAGGHPDIWYASNIEIVDYIKAMRSLKFGCNRDMVLNQSGRSVWISADGEPREIKPGELLKFD